MVKLSDLVFMTHVQQDYKMVLDFETNKVSIWVFNDDMPLAISQAINFMATKLCITT